MLDKFDTKSAIAVTLIASMVAMAFLLAIRNPESDIFKMLMGGLVTVGFASVINFYFGSSSGSKAKDDTLNQIAVASAVPLTPQPASPISTPTNP